MRSFQDRLEDFDARGFRILAISVDPPETSRDLRRTQGYTFPLLSDTQAEVIRAYDLIHEDAGPEGTDLSRPAEFLVDATGTVRWVNLTESYAVRVWPEEALRAIDDLGPGRHSPG